MENEKMTLWGYYASLPERRSPKRDFLREAALECHTSQTTVRNWVVYGMKPRNFRHVEIMAELTGIPREVLWGDNGKNALLDYYGALPEMSSPKKDFLNEIASRCSITVTSARNWVLYGRKPREHRHVEILAELTGISSDSLWGK